MMLDYKPTCTFFLPALSAYDLSLLHMIEHVDSHTKGNIQCIIHVHVHVHGNINTTCTCTW